MLIINGILYSKDLNKAEYVPNEIILKLASETKIISPHSLTTDVAEIDAALLKFAITDISPVVPYKKDLNPRLPDINRIYRIKYTDSILPDILSDDLSELKHVIYAEPRHIPYETTTPNDPYYTNQWHLPVIDADLAWNVTQGDTNVIIAIIDDAIDLGHEDLAANIFINWAEYNGTIGLDDDFNGYVDDINGWDFAEYDNDPNPVISDQDHGTHVAGCASAVTDNGIGVAAPGWKCKILPLKFSNDSNGSLSGDYPAAIIYAADMNAAVINCSFGRHGGGVSNYQLDAITYAHELGTLVIASAGNSNENELHYPSAYLNVLSVASTANGDYKSGFSTYHLSVDISSPGSGILSTTLDNDYATASGTSMAAPIAAGVAALIKSQFNFLSSYELALRLSATADDIYNINQDYYLLLGTGRVNANNGIIYTESQFNDFPVRLDLFQFSATDTIGGDGDGSLDPGETIYLTTKLYNYSLLGSDNIDLYLTSDDPRYTIIDESEQSLSVVYEDSLSISNGFSILIEDTVINDQAGGLTLEVYQDNNYLNSFDLNMNIGKSPILLVDDDDGMYVEGFYTTIIDSLGIPYAFWDRQNNGTPNIEMLQGYPIVIWLCEWAFPSLDSLDRNVLSQYLDGGGNLYISGQDIGCDLGWSGCGASGQYNQSGGLSLEFYNDYMRADFGGDDANIMSAIGMYNDPISHGLTFDFYQPGHPSQYQFPDYFSPINGAIPIFNYTNGLVMGLRYSGVYNLVYTGIGLEAFGSSQNSEPPDDVNQIQNIVLERIINFLNPIRHESLFDQPDSTADLYFYVQLYQDGEGFNDPVLYYRFNDGGSYNALEMADTSDGYYALLPGPGQSDTLEYYFYINNMFYEWTNPINTAQPYQCSIGRDIINPEVSELTSLPNVIDRFGVATVSVQAWDNAGLDSVLLKWYRSTVPDNIQTIAMFNDGNVYTGDLVWNNASGNELFYYFVKAIDISQDGNIGYSDTMNFQIINNAVITSWDNQIIGPWNTGNHWGLMYINANVGYGMNDSPGGNYENNNSDHLTLLEPFDLSDYQSAYLQFWMGSFLRDNDIGTVEISSNATNWQPIYSITGINVIDTVIVDVTDYLDSDLYLRFHIVTDASGVSSGWYIDDIHLLVDTSIVLTSNNEVGLPLDFSLSQNYPNPFNPTTAIQFSLPEEHIVTIEVFDMLGRLISTIYKRKTQPGEHIVHWDATDNQHNPVSTGVYFYRIQSATANYSQTRKMLYLK